MSKIKPFKGYTPKPELAKQIASYPYDVVNCAEAKILVKDNPLSFLRVVKGEVDFPDGVDEHSDPIYRKGKENLQALIANKHLLLNEKPCFYLYQQIMRQYKQIGLVISASISEYLEDKIKKHELTREEKENDRVKHIETLETNTGPVFLTYRHNQEIDQKVASLSASKPYISFIADDGITHNLWVVDQQDDIDFFIHAFAQIDALYIADGHHRAAASVRVGTKKRSENPNHTGEEPWNYFLSVAFPDNQLNILDYNRALKTLNGFTEESLLDELKKKFHVEKLNVSNPNDAKPTQPQQFSMYLNQSWYKLIAKEEIIPHDNLIGSLDVSILQNEVLSPLFNIKNPRTSNDIDFIGGIRGLVELEKRCKEDCKVAFALYPTSISQLLDIADSNQIMPPNSTWFEPKLRSGMVVRPFIN